MLTQKPDMVSNMKKNFHSLANAQRSARKLRIKSILEYNTKRHLDDLLPSNPGRTYANSGWKDWYEFLGTVKSKYYPSYSEAKSATQDLSITSGRDYHARHSKDPRLPAKPQEFYFGRGWKSWQEYLGNPKKTRFYALYSKAQDAAQVLGANTSRDYHRLYHTNSLLPANPHFYYSGKGWTDWKTFLGQNSPYYKTYDEASDAASKLMITSVPVYKMRRREDPGLPPHPEILYAIQWKSFYDFFGKNKRADFYSTYLEAQVATHSLGLRNRKDYSSGYRQDKQLPSNPDKFYRTCGWKSWRAFCGIDYYESYADAKKAAQKLGAKTIKEYHLRCGEDAKLHSMPRTIYAEWEGWTAFLGLVKRSYHSFDDARAAVQKMGFEREADYRLRYSEDPMLPENPKVLYQRQGWRGFRHFVGKERYKTLSETKMAAQTLMIGNSSEYQIRYREDVRLPALPEKYYPTEWISWHDLLDIPKRVCYETYDQACNAVRRLGVKSISEYRARYLEDPRLPGAPMAFYKDSLDWYNFLGNEKPNFYTRLSEAKLAVQILGIKTRKEYADRYKEDPRLPAVPDDMYIKDDWLHWYDFLGKKKPVDYTLQFPNIWADVKKWLENCLDIKNRKYALIRYLSDYYLPSGLPDDSVYLLIRSNPFNAEGYRQFVESVPEDLRRKTHSIILSFYNWALKEYCTDTEGYESIVIPDCRNPLETIMAGFAESLQTYRPTQSTKTPLGYEYILRAREYLVPEGELALLKKPNLTQLPQVQELFNTRIDWLEVEETMIDHADPNCIWRHENIQRVINGRLRKIKAFQIWSPARFVALYTLLRFPLRGLQITLLDSGEADAEVPCLDLELGAIRWEHNPSSLASNRSNKKQPQGAVQRGYQDLPKFHVTTNKTGARDDGYEIEWIPDDLVYWFLTLRDWQVKYNPLSGPTSWISIESVIGSDRLSKKVLQARGTQCFLFRTSSSGKPLSTSTAFGDTLPALLYRIQRQGENLATPSDRGKYLSPYTPHSLRVSLITAFIADGNAPIHLISKLVGHKSLVMTIYYVKLNAEQMRRTMGETEKRAGQLVAEKDGNTIRLEGLHPLRDKLIATDGNRALLESDVPNSSCVIFDWGVCPMSAASCHIGGLDSTPGRPDLAIPVPAGYLGQKNCTRCRFFVTGIPFLGGLVALANEISLEIYTESGRFDSFSNLVRELEYEYYDVIEKGGVDIKQWERKRATANEQQSGGKLDGLLNDYARLNHFIQSCLALMNQRNDDAKPSEHLTLVVAGDLEDIGLAICESKGQYHLLAEICQNASIYQSTNPSRAIPLISQAIDRMAENNQLKPAMFRLTDDQKLKIINELNQLLLSRLGSWERIDDLFSGDLMLLDVDSHRPEITRVSSDVQSILMRASSVIPDSRKVDHE